CGPGGGWSGRPGMRPSEAKRLPRAGGVVHSPDPVLSRGSMNELFTQSPPRLGNQYLDDRFLRALLARLLPPEVLADIEPGWTAMGALAGEELYELQLRDRLNEPRLTQWHPCGNRIDEIELTPLWQRAAALAA